MRRATTRTKPRTNWKFRLAALVAVLLAVVAETIAQEKKPDAAESNRRIVVSIPDRKLALVEDGQVIKVYKIAVGASATPSPTGEFTVANRINDPTYYAPGKVIGPGAGNPLGTRWIGLSLKGFGIHGTNEPRSIGKAASHGCIRMGKKDAEELFSLVRVGDVVELHGQRTEELAAIFGTPAPVAPKTAQPAATPVAVVATVVGSR